MLNVLSKTLQYHRALLWVIKNLYPSLTSFGGVLGQKRSKMGLFAEAKKGLNFGHSSRVFDHPVHSSSFSCVLHLLELVYFQPKTLRGYRNIAKSLAQLKMRAMSGDGGTISDERRVMCTKLLQQLEQVIADFGQDGDGEKGLNIISYR